MIRTYILLSVFVFVSNQSSAQCPTITVIGPNAPATPGDTTTFRVETAPTGLRYKWSVTNGTIREGQGTPVITVEIDKTMGVNAIATVEVLGLPPGCPATASEITPIAEIIGEPVDEFSPGRMINDEVRTRFDNFFADLSNNPGHQGLIVLYLPESEKRDIRNRHIRLILDHIKWRKFDLSRIWFSFDTFFEPRATLWRIPPGADVPCGRCKIVKGVDLDRRRR